MVNCMSEEEKQEEVSENVEEKIEEKPVEEVVEENVGAGSESEEHQAPENSQEESAPEEEKISDDVETTAGEEVREEAPAEEEKSVEEAPVRTELPKPVAVGDELDVTIESVGAKGDGIAKKDGFVIFIANVTKGETVRIKITELKSSFAIGEKV